MLSRPLRLYLFENTFMLKWKDLHANWILVLLRAFLRSIWMVRQKWRMHSHCFCEWIPCPLPQFSDNTKQGFFILKLLWVACGPCFSWILIAFSLGGRTSLKRCFYSLNRLKFILKFKYFQSSIVALRNVKLRKNCLFFIYMWPCLWNAGRSLWHKEHQSLILIVNCRSHSLSLTWWILRDSLPQNIIKNTPFSCNADIMKQLVTRHMWANAIAQTKLT